jgi:hypothetical protein
LKNRAEIKLINVVSRKQTMSTKETNTGPDERPKAFRYRDRINAVEEMIVNALPDIAAKLISMAKDGDVAAARYLFDRMAGRPSKLPTPPSMDREIPYTGLDWSADLLKRKDQRESKVSAYMASISARRYDPAGDKKPTSFPGIGTPSVRLPGSEI